MKKILAIEDDTVVLKILQSRFSKTGTEVLVAIDPEEGLRKAEEEQPDVIILGMVLPKISGLETLKRLKKNPKTKNIPVIINTIIGREDNAQEALRLGATDYFIKGMISLDELVTKVTDVASRRKKT